MVLPRVTDPITFVFGVLTHGQLVAHRRVIKLTIVFVRVTTPRKQLGTDQLLQLVLLALGVLVPGKVAFSLS